MVRAALAGLDQKGDGAGEGKIDSEEPLAEGETGLAALTGCDGLPSALQDAPVIRPHPPVLAPHDRVMMPLEQRAFVLRTADGDDDTGWRRMMPVTVLLSVSFTTQARRLHSPTRRCAAEPVSPPASRHAG